MAIFVNIKKGSKMDCEIYFTEIHTP